MLGCSVAKTSDFISVVGLRKNEREGAQSHQHSFFLYSLHNPMHIDKAKYSWIERAFAPNSVRFQMRLDDPRTIPSRRMMHAAPVIGNFLTRRLSTP